MANLSVTCGCGKALTYTPEFAGKRVKCPACGKPVQVPADTATRRAALCKSHPEAKAVGRCGACNAPICAACRQERGYFCSDACKGREVERVVPGTGPRCKHHDDKPADGRCGTCNAPLCARCVAVNHGFCTEACARSAPGPGAKPPLRSASPRARPDYVQWTVKGGGTAALVAAALWIYLATRTKEVGEAWKVTAESERLEDLVAAGDRVFVFETGGAIWEMDPSNGSKKRTVREKRTEEDGWYWYGGGSIVGDLVLETHPESVKAFSLAQGAAAWEAKGFRAARGEIGWFWREQRKAVERLYGTLTEGEGKDAAHHLAALDVKTGRIAWRAPLAHAGVGGVEAGHGFVAAFLPGAGRKRELALFSDKDGRRLWTIPVADNSATPIPSPRGCVLLGQDGLEMRDLKEGKLLWSVEFPDYRKIGLPRVWAHGDGLFAAASGALTRLDAATGNPTWFALGPESFWSWGMLGERMIISGYHAHHLCDKLKEPLLPAGQCTLVAQLAREEQMASMRQIPVVYAIDPATGRVEWLQKARGGGMQILDGDIFTCSPNDAAMATALFEGPGKTVTPQTMRQIDAVGEIRWEYQFEGSTTSIVRAGDRLIFGCRSGIPGRPAQIIAIRVR